MRTPGPTTAVDVDGQVLRIVQVVPRGNRAAVSRIVVERLDPVPDADQADPVTLGKAIAKAIEHSRLKPTTVVMGVPRAMVIIRTLSLPVIEDLRELASMVHLQVGKDLPFRLDEAVIDFKVRRRLGSVVSSGTEEAGQKHPENATPEPMSEPPKLEVLVAVVKRDVVDFYQKMALAAELKLAGLGWLSYANARVVEAAQLAPGGEAVALVSLRPEEVNVDIVAQQALLFSRGAVLKPHHPMVGLPSTLEAGVSPDQRDKAASPDEAPSEPSLAQPTFVEGAAIEVVRSLHSYAGMEAQNPVVKVVVAGASGQESAVVEALNKRLNVPCSQWDVAGKLDLPKVAREQAAGCISAIGLGLGACDPQGLSFDFLNPKRPAVQRNLRRLRIMGAAAVAALCLFVLLVIRSHLLGKRSLTNRALLVEITEAEKKRPLYRQMKVQSTTIQDWLKGGQNWLEHYAYLSAILPPCEELYTTSLQVSGQGAIRLAVQARSGEILAKLDKQLRAAGYDVKPLPLTPGADKSGYPFRSTVELIVPAKMNIDLSKVRAPVRPEDDASLDKPARRSAAPNDDGSADKSQKAALSRKGAS